jgi:hypothetical protein
MLLLQLLLHRLLTDNCSCCFYTCGLSLLLPLPARLPITLPTTLPIVLPPAAVAVAALTDLTTLPWRLRLPLPLPAAPGSIPTTSSSSSRSKQRLWPTL